MPQNQQTEIDNLKKTVETLRQKISDLSTHFELLHEVIARTPGNVYWKNTTGEYLGCNNNVAHLFQLESPKEIIGFNNSQLIKHLQNKTQQNKKGFTKRVSSGSLLKQTEDIDHIVLSTQKEITIEEPGLNDQLEPTIYLSKKIPLIVNEKAVGLIGISFDISDRKKMELDLQAAKEKAEEANRSKSEFIANMSHDIKTPLASIIGLSELLNQRLQDEELKFSQTVHTSSQHLLQFFDNCLEVFKLESKNLSLPIESFDLNTLINEMNKIFQPLLYNNDIKLETKTDFAEPFYITASRLGIYRICLNLISNAIKFTKNGLINLNISHQKQNEQDQLTITVKDTGIGMPQSKLDYIFERFTRLIPSYKGTYDGSGIGLYIVKKFSQGMNASIQVESEEGVGSTFTITIPIELAKNANELLSCEIPYNPDASSISPKNPAPLNNIDTQPQKNKKTPNAKILLVEDNQVVQQIQTSLLKSLGHTVDIVSSGEEALEYFEPNQYKIILMDIGLPGIQGDLAAKLIRKMEHSNHHQKSIIVALTAHSTEQMEMQYYEAGIDEVINKPLSQQQAERLFSKYLKKDQ